MIKIGIEGTSIFKQSGIDIYTRSLLEGFALLEDDFKISILVPFRKKEKFRRSFSNLKNLEFIEAFPNSLILGYKFKPLIEKLNHLFYVKKESKKLDLYHWTNPCYYYNNLENSVVTIHDIFPFYKDEWAFKALAETKDIFAERFLLAFKHCKMLFVPSETVKNEILASFPYVLSEKIHVTYEAASPDFRLIKRDESVFDKYGIASDIPNYLYVSRIDPRKNIDRIFQAFSEMKETANGKINLVVVGGGMPPEIEYIQNLAKIFGISGKVIHTKNVSNYELAQLYNSALALVFPSFAEGFGLPVVEAMTCGCPVITSDLSCMPEIAGGAALLVDPYNHNSIKNAMSQILEDSVFRNELIEKGLERAKFFSWKKCAAETLKGYKKALGK